MANQINAETEEKVLNKAELKEQKKQENLKKKNAKKDKKEKKTGFV